MRRITTVTALSVAGVILAAGTAAALNAQVLGGPSRSSVGTADTLLPDDPFSTPTIDETGTAEPSAEATDEPTGEATDSAEPSTSTKPSAKPSTKPSTSRPVSPSTVPSTGGGSTLEPGDDKGGDSGNSGSGSGDSSGGSGGSGSSGSGGGDDKPEDD